VPLAKANTCPGETTMRSSSAVPYISMRALLKACKLSLEASA
jgi:hypothetical protein